jgi:hypothetical protein
MSSDLLASDVDAHPETEPKLAGAEEVADILDVPVETARRLQDSHDLVPPFPPPLAELEAGPVWDRDDIIDWRARRAEAWRHAGAGRAPTAPLNGAS